MGIDLTLDKGVSWPPRTSLAIAFRCLAASDVSRYRLSLLDRYGSHLLSLSTRQLVVAQGRT